jgi:choline-glycine betaine transporter
LDNFHLVPTTLQAVVEALVEPLLELQVLVAVERVHRIQAMLVLTELPIQVVAVVVVQALLVGATAAQAL